LHAQHLLKPDFDSPAEVVRWFGAVQAQDFLASLYAIGLRMRLGTQESVEEAIVNKSIVRTWPMRGTIHFVPPEDARWMLKLLARRGLSSNGAMYRRLGLTEAIFRRAHEVVAGALKGGKQLTRAEIYRVLEGLGIRTAGEQRGLHILGRLAREGLICFGPRRGKQHTFTLLEEWIPAGRQLQDDEALAELARRYFTSHGPATSQDFAWWSGLTIKDARAARDAVRTGLYAQYAEGQEYWSGFDPKSLTPTVGQGCLLPAFDELAVGYKDRRALLGDTPEGAAGAGLGPNIIINGQIAGSWKRTLARGSVVLELNLFAAVNKRQQAGLVNAAKQYGRFLGLPVTLQP
jgi:hypothetical protein